MVIGYARKCDRSYRTAGRPSSLARVRLPATPAHRPALGFGNRTLETGCTMPFLPSPIDGRVTTTPGGLPVGFALCQIQLQWMDHGLIVAYALLVLAIGLGFSRQQGSSANYLLAGRSMGWVTVGISQLASLLSAISYLGSPGEAYGHDLQYLLFSICGFLSVPIAVYFFLNFFYRLQVTSIYEYLERRFNYPTRLLASAVFVTARLAWMATIVVAVSLAIEELTGIEPAVSIPPDHGGGHRLHPGGRHEGHYLDRRPAVFPIHPRPGCNGRLDLLEGLALRDPGRDRPRRQVEDVRLQPGPHHPPHRLDGPDRRRGVGPRQRDRSGQHAALPLLRLPARRPAGGVVQALPGDPGHAADLRPGAGPLRPLPIEPGPGGGDRERGPGLSPLRPERNAGRPGRPHPGLHIRGRHVEHRFGNPYHQHGLRGRLLQAADSARCSRRSLPAAGPWAGRCSGLLSSRCWPSS